MQDKGLRLTPLRVHSLAEGPTNTERGTPNVTSNDLHR
jgi:hypothetical protein